MSDVFDMTQAGNKSLTAAQRKAFDTVHCLLLPLNKEIVILPNAAVAEIIPFYEPEPVNDAPEWFLGQLDWRERRIPLISFETVSEGEVGKMHKGCRVAILNTLNGNSQLPYIALLTQGLPSLQIVRPNAIQFAEKPSVQRQSIKAFVNLNGTAAIIPDIDELESRILRLHQ